KQYKRDDGITADFFNLVAFDKQAAFVEKYLKKGVKILVSGKVQTGSYEKNGMRIPFFEVVVQEQEFAESKNAAQSMSQNPTQTGSKGYSIDEDGFMRVLDDADDELPFN
ncbi:MAG: single-stranded DNA-binding protein, partial [Lachnospiraceae bacterium]|nr:single-stranded DNA-binding protein [Lachnospiraceae bacterium]